MQAEAPLVSTSERGRTRVLRHASPGASWDWWLREPPAHLASRVAGLWLWDGERDDFMRHSELPTSSVELGFTLGPVARVVDGGGVGPGGRNYRGGWISGVRERPMTVESGSRTTRILAVQLRPEGAWALFGGLSLSELANRVIDLDDVLGGRAGTERLRQRMLEAPDTEAALDLAEHWLAACTLGRELHPATRAAMAYLERRDGVARIERIARALGLSARRLRDVFLREVGVSTKRMARLLRFERALARVVAAPARDLATVATECGYYDQAHMNHDFRTFGGRTPSECRTTDLPVVRPGDDAP